MTELTFNQHGNAMIEAAKAKRAEIATIVRAHFSDFDPDLDAAARDLSIAITHLEDALTRYNSARYHEDGTWQRRDPDLLPEP